jgi:hypothetical protein
MILILSAIASWMAFYVSWQLHHSRTILQKFLFSGLYSLSAALICWAAALFYFFGASSAQPADLTGTALGTVLKTAAPLAATGVVVLACTLFFDIRHFRKHRRINPTRS